MNGSVTGPDRFHRIAVNEIIDAIAEIAPNSSVLFRAVVRLLGWELTPAVKMSMSDWMRWSGLSMVSSMKRDR